MTRDQRGVSRVQQAFCFQKGLHSPIFIPNIRFTNGGHYFAYRFLEYDPSFPFWMELINRKITDHHTASRGNWKPFLDKRQASAWYEKI